MDFWTKLKIETIQKRIITWAKEKWTGIVIVMFLFVAAFSVFKAITDKQIEENEKRCFTQCEEICSKICNERK